jgi:hypothetical protein
MTRGSSPLLHVSANSTSLSLSPRYFEYKTVVTIVGLDNLTTVSLLARLSVNYWGCLPLSCRRQKGGGLKRDGTTELSRQWTKQQAGQYNIKEARRNRSGRYVKNPGKYRPVEAYEKAGQYGARGGIWRWKDHPFAAQHPYFKILSLTYPSRGIWKALGAFGA